MGGNGLFVYDECSVCCSDAKEKDVNGTGFLVHRMVGNCVVNTRNWVKVYLYAAYK